MRVSQRNFVRPFAWGANGSRGSGPWILLAAIFLVVALVTTVILQSRPAKAVAKKQAALLDGIERRSPARIQRLISRNYADRWDFTGEDIVEAMVDSGSQFIALVVTPEDQSVAIEDGKAEVSMKLILGGKPVGPVGGEVMKRINQLGVPFVFTWEKQSSLPSSWRLVRVDNAALPDDLFGYEPGDIRRAMRGE